MNQPKMLSLLPPFVWALPVLNNNPFPVRLLCGQWTVRKLLLPQSVMYHCFSLSSTHSHSDFGFVFYHRNPLRGLLGMWCEALIVGQFSFCVLIVWTRALEQKWNEQLLFIHVKDPAVVQHSARTIDKYKFGPICLLIISDASCHARKTG